MTPAATPTLNIHAERLAAAFARVGAMLQAYALARGRAGQPVPTPPDEPVAGAALDLLGDWFGLSPFELATVVLAAGADMAPDIGQLCALAQGDTAMPYPTVALALAVFADEVGATHAAFAPGAPLRRYRLVTFGPPGTTGRLQQRIGVAESLLATLAGEPALDPALDALLEPLAAPVLLPSEKTYVDGLVRTALAAPDAVLQVAATPDRRALGLAAAAAATLGCTPFHLPLARFAADAERDDLLACWQRDRMALGGALVVSFEELVAEQQALLLQLIVARPGPLFLVAQSGSELSARTAAPVVRAPPPVPDPAELATALAEELGLPPDPAFTALVRQFRVPRAAIASCARIALAGGDADPAAFLPRLRRLLRDQVREGMAGLADRIEVRLSLDDLVVPPAAQAVLDQIVARQRQHGTVLEEWGFAASGGGPQGMSVVFSGPSGTGKTMAAEALAHALGLDLYRVDLSRIVDKYIGETEKRLSALFDAADVSDAVLLFDEADVLFGRRTEVRDSHDRYANLEVGYLLQRIEQFRGVAVLTTNLPNAIDEAFVRRFAFNLAFEFPGEAERRTIWQHAIPAEAPVAELDWDQLAQLALTGGQIRVISVQAAMLAANEGSAITMDHFARALVSDLAKQRRRVPAGLFAGWKK